MTDKDLEIARLKGKVEALQNQNGSSSIDLLRLQVKQLQDANSKLQADMMKMAADFVKLETRVSERMNEAARVVQSLQRELREMKEGEVIPDAQRKP